MSTPHKHHFIPAFYLRQWHGPDDKLVEYTIKHGKLIPKPVSADATGFERDLYAFPDLPPNLSQFMEQKFWDYADRTASQALGMLLAGYPRTLWSSDMLSAWVRFLIGVHTRHPDTMPEIRTAAKAIWEGSAEQSQRRYEEIREPGDPETFDEWIATKDPLIPDKAALELVMSSIDNEIVGLHMMQMKWRVIEISTTPRRFLTSDRPVGMYMMKEPNGSITMPLSPTKLFVAVNDERYLDQFCQKKDREIVDAINSDHLQRARKFVWAASKSHSQTEFIRAHMGKKMEPLPFFPSLSRYTASVTQAADE
ncbi:MAG TPA: DUF4238 domain-containing protein [Stellaceae bacterium]|nr:DUF4238 domain-containing protein [Stellaceae bacterium]